MRCSDKTSLLIGQVAGHVAPVWGHVFLVGGCQFQSVGGVGTGFGFVGLDVDWRGVGWACSTADIKFSSLAFDLTVPLATEASG